MEKMDNNKTEPGYIEEPLYPCNLKTNQKPIQITKEILFFSTKRFYKSGPTFPVKIVEKEMEQQQNLKLRLEGEARAEKRLQELKKKFCNLLMRNGEKSKACKLFYQSLKQVEDKNLVKKTTGELFDFFKQEKQGYFLEPVYKTDQGSNPCFDQKQQRKEKKNKDLYPYKSIQHFYNEFLRKNTLYQAVENVKPTLELRRVRKGGTTYQVPAIVSQKRQERLAIKWIIESAEKRKKKSNNTFSNCLVSEILDAFNKTGQPKQRRDEQLKVAEFNRAYTRYRWW